MPHHEIGLHKFVNLWLDNNSRKHFCFFGKFYLLFIFNIVQFTNY